MFADADFEDLPAACSCPESEAEGPCPHSYAFLSYLIVQLKTRGTALRGRIDRKDFTPGKPSRKHLQPDQSEIALRQLDDLVRRSETRLNRIVDADDPMPESNEVRDQRLVWDITRAYNTLEITPVLQQRKKRGDGYTKGKRLSPEKLITDRSIPLSPADEKVLGEIETDRYGGYYSRGQYTLDALDAITHLVGQPNVTFGDEPFEVRQRSMVLGIVTDQGRSKFSFGIVGEDGRPVAGAVVGSDTAALMIDIDNKCLHLSQMDEDQMDLINRLLSFPPVAPEHLEALLARAKSLQKSVSILLPQDNCGPIVREPAPMALLLRSRSNGTLDVAMRIRDAGGSLKRPGSEPTIRSITRDGKPVQVQRLLDVELRRAADVCDSIGIEVDSQTWFGSLSDFRKGLALIERLQSGDFDVEVLWDKSSEKPVTVLGNLTSKNVRVDITSKRNWFGVTGEADFGGKKMPLKELLDGLSVTGDDAIQGDYLKIGDGQWARISKQLQERLKKLRDATHADRSTLKMDATSAPAIRDLMDSDVEVKAAKSWQKCLDRLARAEKLDPKLPAGLDATLRDYQIDGFKWLRRLAEWGVGGILADDMGLGKTLQTLAVLLDRSADGPMLVIAPTSVGFNWVRETERFAPSLNVHLYRETERGEFLPSVGPGDLVVCSYGLALRDADALADVQWNTVVLDEAQAIKNSRSKTSKAIAGLNSDWFVALTGTPVENHLGELWSLFHVASPGVFGGWDHFRKRYAVPIEKQNDDDARKSLAERLRPFVLRRTKKEVLTELPPRTEMNLYVDLSPAERKEYENVRLAALGEIDQIESLPNIQDQRFRILAMLTRLRQISCHVGMVNENWKESSAKLDQLCETLESLKEEGHRALVFSQFTKHLALIRTALEERGFTFEYLDGSTAAGKRQEAVDRFQNGNADVFLISLKAGGTGLNLTAADYVIHMDPWWNPAVEDQATDRAHRIGQDKPVMVYRIVARGTIEEEILALHETKRDLVAGVMDGTEAAAKLSNEDLIRMLRQ